MATYNHSKERSALIASLYDELALLEECPHETQAIIKKVSGLLHQLRSLELSVENDQDMDPVDLESPLGACDSELVSPVSGDETSSAESGEEWQWEGAERESDEESDGEMNSHLKEKLCRKEE